MNKSNYSSLFISEEETFICALGNSYFEKFISDGSIGDGFAILSNERVYFKGKTLWFEGRHLRSRSQEQIVDVKDITGTGFIKFSPLYYLYIGIGLLLYILTFIFTEGFNLSFNTFGTPFAHVNVDLIMIILLFFIPLLVCVFLLFKYFIRKKNLFKIEFPGGSIAFDTKMLGANEAREFQKNIRITKDRNIKSKNIDTTNSNFNLSDQIKEYANLLKEGLISEEEFSKIKKKMLD